MFYNLWETFSIKGKKEQYRIPALLWCSSDDSNNLGALNIGQFENYGTLKTYYLCLYFIQNLCSYFYFAT